MVQFGALRLIGLVDRLTESQELQFLEEGRVQERLEGLVVAGDRVWRIRLEYREGEGKREVLGPNVSRARCRKNHTSGD
jgi:hypothetical protein